MANGTVKCVNVTKYDAGGSGDNVIADGYIKSVPKVWIDTYALTATSGPALTVGTMLLCGYIPENKKIIGCDVYFPAALSGAAVTGTGTTISIGVKLASGATNGTLFLSGGECLTATTKLEAGTNLPYVVTGGTNQIILTFARLAPTVTAGNITIVTTYV